MKHTLISSTLLAVLITGPSARAQAPEAASAPPRKTATVFVDSAALGKNVTDFVAKVGKPEVVSIAQGETVGNVVERQCGRLDLNYLAAIRQRLAADLPAGFDLPSTFAASHTLMLPPCLRLPQPIGEGYPSGPPGLIAGAAGLLAEPPETGGTFLSLFGPLCSVTTQADQATCALIPAIQLPSVTALTSSLTSSTETDQPPLTHGWSSVAVRARQNLSAQAVGEQLRALLIANGQAPETARTEDPHQLKLYSALTDGELQDASACQVGSGMEVPVGSQGVPQVVEVLSHSLGRLAKKGPDHVSILIPDTGLEGAGDNSPFSKVRLKSWSQWPVQPYVGYEKHRHGTYVATRALGGPSLMQIISAMGLDIEVAPVNVFERPKACGGDGQPTCPPFAVDLTSFDNAILRASEPPARHMIVNLSVGRDQKIDGIARELGTHSPLLFVVAAGNDHRDLGDSNPASNVYPALYGAKENVITVAALDLNGQRRASFSNYGASYVDISAPGCRQPVLSYDPQSGGFEVVAVSGTSFAAPNVSFVAALLEATWPEASPQEVKRRLITSSDIVPELAQDGIKDGRRLNPAKALAVYEDVIEAEIEGRRITIRGEIDETEAPFDFCDGHHSLYLSGAGKNLLKKVALSGGTPPGFLIYYLKDGELASATCARQDLTLKIRDNFTHWTYSLSADQIVDVVAAERHAGDEAVQEH
jgi:hypothetical protein